MKWVSMHRPSPSMAVALTALVIASGGTAVATSSLVNGDKLIKRGTLSGSRLRNHTITGTQVNLSQLGKVPRATRADTATTASKLTPGAFSSLAVNNAGQWFDDFLAGHTNTGSPLGYYLDREGFVHLRGAAYRTSGANNVIATLPAGARPAGTPGTNCSYLFVYTYNSTQGVILLCADGTINYASGNTNYISLDGIVFQQGN